MNHILLDNARIWADGKFTDGSILIADNKIERVATKTSRDESPANPEEETRVSSLRDEITSGDPRDEKIVIDAEGAYIVPGLVDMHVHFREPGYSYKETIFAGSRAALAGGFTTVCTMPNLNPAPDSIDNLKKQLEIIARDAQMQVIPYATITRQRMGDELIDYEALAPWVAGFSDDGSGVQSEEVMREAMRRIAKTGKILAAHCEVNSLLRGGYIHDGEYARAHGHRGICSESEWKEIERDIRLAEETGCRLHVCHISTKESVDLIRKAKARGVQVTCETGPHYLTFSDKFLQENGRWKMNPPIRSEADRDALREGLIDGTIDVVATDHAPHSAAEKDKGLEKSAMGVVGLETAYKAVYYTMVESGLMPFERLVEVMTINPRRILGLPGADGPKPGDWADLTMLSTEGSSLVYPPKFLSKGRATPYDGLILTGKVVATIFSGRIWTDEELKVERL